ncbi:hypothetical protein ACHAXN_010147 [Cyclotella atomus]
MTSQNVQEQDALPNLKTLASPNLALVLHTSTLSRSMPQTITSGSSNGEVTSNLLVHHKSKNSHHGGTSVVQLNSTFLQLGLLVELVPSEVNGTVTEVTDELSSSDVLHDEKLKETNEGNNLSQSGSGDGVGSVNGGPSVGEGVEGVSGVVNVSGEVDTSTSDDVTQEGKLGNTSVLQLNVTETVETLLVGVVQQSQGIEESKRRLDTKLVLEGGEGGGGLAGLGRGEGGGAGDEGGNDGRLHGCCWGCILHLAACRYGNMKLTDQQRSVLSLSLITLISNASFSTIAPILPLECDAYQISEQWLSLIFLAYPVGFCVAAPLIAKWFEVVGTVQIMIWGMRSVGSIFLCMSFVFSFDAPSHLRIALLTMGQFSLGASMSTVSTGYYSLATLICSDQEKAMSYIESAVGLGYITGAILGSMMYEWLGYELAYRGVAFVMFVMSLGASNFLMKYLTCKSDKEIDFFDVEVPRDVVLASTNNTQVDGHIDDQQDSITQLSDKSTFCIEKDSNMLRIDQQEQIVCNKTILTTCSLLHHAKITSAGMSILWISASWSFLEPILAKRLLQFSLGKREIGVMFALSNIIYVPTAFFIQYIPKRYGILLDHWQIRCMGPQQHHK